MSDVKLLKETLKELRVIADMHHTVWFQEFKKLQKAVVQRQL